MVIHSKVFGGAERHAVVLAEKLREMGNEVIFVCPRGTWTYNAIRERPVEVVPLPLNGTYDMYSLLRLVLLTKAKRADLLHGHLTRSAFYVNWASRLSGVPSVVTAHATNTHKHFNGAKKIIAVSEAVKRHLIEKGYREGDIKVIYSGVEDIMALYGERRPEIRRQLGLRKDEVAVVQLGRFIEDKAQDITLQALNKLGRLPFRVFFIGDDTTEWAGRIKDMVRNFGLEDRVEFLGHREDARRVLCGMDIMVQPSRREALGLSVLEALSAGVPVVASSVGGLPEVVEDGVNGFVVCPEDPEALSERIRALVIDRSLREALSGGARQTYLRRFTLERMAQETAGVYREVLRAS